MFPRENNSDNIQDRPQRTIIHKFNQLSAFRRNTNKHPKELKEGRNKMTEAQRDTSGQMSGIMRALPDTNVKFNKEREVLKKTQTDYEAGNEKHSIIKLSV